jgi:hypothetical protein
MENARGRFVVGKIEYSHLAFWRSFPKGREFLLCQLFADSVSTSAKAGNWWRECPHG